MTHAGTSERVPFDLLIGDWIGVGIVFLPNGAYYSHISSRVTLHDVNQGGNRFLDYYNNSGGGLQVPGHQEKAIGEDHLDNVFGDDGLKNLFKGVVTSICRCKYRMRFLVEGKTCKAIEKSSSIQSAIGFMSTNDNYSFIINDQYTSGGNSQTLTLHNNHYFSSSNTRHVFGTIADAQGRTVLLTSFTYTSYTPPPKP